MSAEPFLNQLNRLVATELTAVSRLGVEDGHLRLCVALEGLCSSAGLVVATAAKGHPEAMSELLEGASQHMFEQAAHWQNLGAFLGRPRGAA